MQSIDAELARCGSKNECVRTDNDFSPYMRSAMIA